MFWNSDKTPLTTKLPLCNSQNFIRKYDVMHMFFSGRFSDIGRNLVRQASVWWNCGKTLVIRDRNLAEKFGVLGRKLNKVDIPCRCGFKAHKSNFEYHCASDTSEAVIKNLHSLWSCYLLRLSWNSNASHLYKSTSQQGSHPCWGSAKYKSQTTTSRSRLNGVSMSCL